VNTDFGVGIDILKYPISARLFGIAHELYIALEQTDDTDVMLCGRAALTDPRAIAVIKLVLRDPRGLIDFFPEVTIDFAQSTLTF